MFQGPGLVYTLVYGLHGRLTGILTVLDHVFTEFSTCLDHVLLSLVPVLTIIDLRIDLELT